MEQLQQRMVGIAISLLRNYGVLGSASKILAVASHGVKSLIDSGGSSEPSGSAPPPVVRERAKNVGEGVVEGGKALARSLAEVRASVCVCV